MPIKESSKKSPAGKAENISAAGPVLIFMRHGVRSFESDSLSVEGMHQAASLSGTLLTKKVPLPDRLESSPKKRTQATLAGLASELGLRVQIDRRLDERSGGESEADFEVRVKEFLTDCDVWGAKAPTTSVRLVCSHLDWLESAILFVTSDENDFERSEPWPPLAIRAYNYDGGIWKRRKA